MNNGASNSAFKSSTKKKKLDIDVTEELANVNSARHNPGNDGLDSFLFSGVADVPTSLRRGQTESEMTTQRANMLENGNSAIDFKIDDDDIDLTLNADKKDQPMVLQTIDPMMDPDNSNN